MDNLLIIGISLQIVAFDERLDPLFDKQRLWLELGHQQLNCLPQKLVHLDRFAGLHYLDDGTIDRVNTVLLNSLLDLLDFFTSVGLRDHHRHKVAVSVALEVFVHKYLIFSGETGNRGLLA